MVIMIFYKFKCVLNMLSDSLIITEARDKGLVSCEMWTRVVQVLDGQVITDRRLNSQHVLL